MPAASRCVERAVRQPRLRDGGPQLPRDELARAGMRRVSLDHDRATGGERGRGVAAGGREGEREVARAEHRHGPDRHEHAPHVGPRDRLGGGIRRVDDRLDVVARIEQRGERLELAGGPLELAAQPALGKAGLAPGHRDDLVAGGAQPCCGAAQQRGAGRAVTQRRIVERTPGGVDGGRHVGRGGLVVAGPGNAGRGIDGIECRSSSGVRYWLGEQTSSQPRWFYHQTVPEAELAPFSFPQRYERIAERLTADIRAGRIAPGERLSSERQLARRLEVGRASVREAIAALALRGLLETRPGSGSFVAADALERLASGAEPAVHDAGPFDLLEARLLLEPGVAALAARRGRRDAEAERLLDAMDAAEAEADRSGWNDGDRRFHRRLAALTDNPVLLALAGEVAMLMDQPLWQRLRDDSIARPGRARVHAAEHRMIYEAIVDGDDAAASFYATQHLERVRRYMTTDQET